MYLFVDGARMGYGLGSEANDVSLRDFGQLADVFYLGGTKCGALFGEAVVLLADSLKHRFKTYMKQNGAVLAKGFSDCSSMRFLRTENILRLRHAQTSWQCV